MTGKGKLQSGSGPLDRSGRAVRRNDDRLDGQAGHVAAETSAAGQAGVSAAFACRRRSPARSSPSALRPRNDPAPVCAPVQRSDTTPESEVVPGWRSVRAPASRPARPAIERSWSSSVVRHGRDGRRRRSRGLGNADEVVDDRAAVGGGATRAPPLYGGDVRDHAAIATLVTNRASTKPLIARKPACGLSDSRRAGDQRSRSRRAPGEEP